MEAVAQNSGMNPEFRAPQPAQSARIDWANVIIAALLMVATLPGRTHGLGLITEPMLRDLRLDRVSYASLNLWATLMGAVFCLPAGWVFDRFGLRLSTTVIVVLLGAVVSIMSVYGGDIGFLFGLVMLTRALGQSALSVASITIVGKGASRRVGFTMGFYSVLMTIFFSLAFKIIGDQVREQGWRIAWGNIGLVLLAGVAPVVLFLLPEAKGDSARGEAAAREDTPAGLPLGKALGQPAFWVFAGATSLYGLVSSGLGLFNQSVFAERGFGQKTYVTFLSVTTLIALVGQMACGGLTLRWSMQRLLALAMLLYAAGLAFLPRVTTLPQLWLVGTLLGLAGGMVTVIFFAIWSHAFGRAHLGRIQGAAQMVTVLASAVGPLIFAQCHAHFRSDTPALWILAPAVLLFGAAAWCVRLPTFAGQASSKLTPLAG